MRSTAFIVLVLIFFCQYSGAQHRNQSFKMEVSTPHTLTVNTLIDSSTEIFPFEKKIKSFSDLVIHAKVNLEHENSFVRLIYLDENFNEFLLAESYGLLDQPGSFILENIGEETSMLGKSVPYSIQIELKDASIEILSLNYSPGQSPNAELKNKRKTKIRNQHKFKIDQINKSLKSRGARWSAGPTTVSQLSYTEKKKLFGSSNFPAGFEYYSGGVISSGESTLKSASAQSSPMVDSWDWRDRHGKNWISPVKNQASCGSCWAFSSTGATEAIVNLFYNQLINPDLSEQELLSCSGAGSCNGGLPSTALNYIASNGLVDEGTFPYAETEASCNNKGSSPSEQFKIGGKVDFGSTLYPKTEDALKKMIIEMGPVNGGLYDWKHTMTLVGYMVVKEGDRFYTLNESNIWSWVTIQSGDPLIGKTVWIFKNSWGAGFGDQGFVYMESPISNFSWTHAIKAPVTSMVKNYDVIYEDRDGDGYYWWGLGPKPASCPGPDQADGNDNDPLLGPLDEYGHCVILNQAPVAGFSTDIKEVTAGNAVQFTDISKNNPTKWQWTFEGGTPSNSAEKNPGVIYETPGTYNVSLTVSNAYGSSTVSVDDCVVVKEETISTDYCLPSANSSDEWIQGVKLNGLENTSSGGGYQDFTNIVFTAEAGKTAQLVLSPGYSRRSISQNWKVWIDFDGDSKFNDSNELVFSTTRIKEAFSTQLNIPSSVPGTTRMRVAMSRDNVYQCGFTGQGEVEDYTISFTSPAPAAPVADFIADDQTVTHGNSVQFQDRSQNSPESWHWSFPGGTPSFSNDRNPVVNYSTPGSYDVKLIVKKTGFSDSEAHEFNFIQVVESSASEYCEPSNINSTRDYIKHFSLGGVINEDSPGEGYSISPNQYTINPGSTYPVSLIPALSNTRNYWKIWLDIDGNGKFDTNELLMEANLHKGKIITNIPIPQNISGETRLRVSMKTGKPQTACEDGFKGEVQDYILTVGAAAQATLTSAGIFDKAECSVYPNPFNQTLYIKITDDLNNARYRILSGNGSIVAEGIITSSETAIELSHLSTGMYFLNVMNNDGVRREKIIKF